MLWDGESFITIDNNMPLTTIICDYELIQGTFQLIEDQTIDIEECNINITCQELDHNLRDMQSYINNVIVEELKHLNKEIQSIKEDLNCCNIEIIEKDINEALKKARRQIKEEGI